MSGISSLLGALLQTPGQRKLKKYLAVLLEILALQPKFAAMSDNELKEFSARLRQRATEGKKDDDLLPEAFALVREVSRRVIGLEHFEEQLVGGIALYHGNTAEMKTGEGKTLVATCPLYLNSVMGHKGHLVTVNDYLAKRDRTWMGPIYEFLGLSVGLLQNDSTPEQRRAAYAADITYGTNNEFGFDYLRDNMAPSLDDQVQKGALDYAIVDEVDNILIDEARTPLIIAGQSEDATTYYYEAARLAVRLKGVPTPKAELGGVEPELPDDVDYTYDEKFKNTTLTETGVHRVEKAFRIANLAAPENLDYMRHINQALQAKQFFHDGSEYMIKNGEIVIVDEFTGRLMPGRRYSGGLHEAIEAKDGLKVQQGTQTLAAITIQNFFKMYRKLAGMTGTAATEADELKEIYGLDVVVIPTHRPFIRIDHDDEVYGSEAGKLHAILKQIQGCHDKGQPVLVGTRSVEKSEALSKDLRKLGIRHEVLNAKYYEKEAEIIAQAGRKGAVTIATNMAGRGVDILLGGNPKGLAGTKADPAKQPEEYKKLLAEYEDICAKEHGEVIALGGLFILGTERHESRRIDNQLRGRCGRQGDPGESKFFLSAEDDILRIFGGDRIQRIFEMMKVEESMPVNHPLLSKTIEMSQKKVEGYNFDARRALVDNDNVLDTQRRVIYEERNSVLSGADLADQAKTFSNDLAEKIAPEIIRAYQEESEDAGRVYNDLVLETFGTPGSMTVEDIRRYAESRDAVTNLAAAIKTQVEGSYQAKRNRYGAGVMHQVEYAVFLHTIDIAWKDELLQLDGLKEGMNLRAMGQENPLITYQKEAYELFEQLMDQIKRDIIRTLLTFEIQPPQPEKKHDRS